MAIKMNSIDALISICILLAGLGILLGAINEQNENSKNTILSAKAKGEALKCAAIIDSIASNTAKDYTGLLDCESNGEKLNANENGTIKSANTIIETQAGEKIVLKLTKHYMD